MLPHYNNGSFTALTKFFLGFLLHIISCCKFGFVSEVFYEVKSLMMSKDHCKQTTTIISCGVHLIKT